MRTDGQPRAELLAELGRLRRAMSDVRGSLLVSTDGLVLVEDTGPDLAEGVAALSAACLGVSHRLAHTVGHQEFEEVLIRSSGGYVAMYLVGHDAVLVVLTAAGVNVGRLNHEARRSVPALSRLLATAGNGVQPQPAAPAPASYSAGALPRRAVRRDPGPQVHHTTGGGSGSFPFINPH